MAILLVEMGWKQKMITPLARSQDLLTQRPTLEFFEIFLKKVEMNAEALPQRPRATEPDFVTRALSIA